VSGEWQVLRRRVAIAGRVVDASTGKPLGDAQVTITAMPPAFSKWLKFAATPYGNRWDKMSERADRTRSRADGWFFFMDLPDGSYRLQASAPDFGRRFGKPEESAKVSRDGQGNIKMAVVKLALQPTMVHGKVTGPGKEPGVPLARVRVKGSGERSFTDSQGKFVVAGIEPGTRTLIVSAQGYRAESQVFTLAGPGESQTVNFTLRRENG
jgi:hypothetical protein